MSKTRQWQSERAKTTEPTYLASSRHDRDGSRVGGEMLGLVLLVKPGRRKKKKKLNSSGKGERKDAIESSTCLVELGMTTQAE